MTENDQTINQRLFDDAYTGAIDPFAVFDAWLAAAGETEINDPEAMALATVDQDGLPDNRMVLLKGRDERGFVFYTNFESAKARELMGTPKAALLFHWKSVRRQVRVRGAVEPVTAEEADAYFATRSRGAQVGAHASAQSSPLASRAELVARAEALEAQFGEAEVPRPVHWSGFRVTPREIEFWQDGEYRLHDRVLFQRDVTGGVWKRTRLNP